MIEKRYYKTKQRDLILSCLQENKGRHITVEMIMEYLKAKGEPVGQTTVYRSLDILVNEGMVFKYNVPEGMGACYQYAEQADCTNHYHLTCVQCGQLIHLQCEFFDKLSKHIHSEHSFQIDSFKTVIYGHCSRCATAK